MRKFILLFFFVIGCFTTKAQKGHEVIYSELSTEDIDFIFKESGKLFLSQQDYSIDRLLKVGNLKFTTSRDFPNEIRVFDEANLLIDKLEIKTRSPRQVLEIYRVQDEVYAVFRAQNIKVYRINQRNNGTFKTESIRMSWKKNSAYFNKVTPFGQYDFVVSDFLGKSSAEFVESTVTVHHKNSKSIDTLGKIESPRDLIVVMQPYSSWTFDVTKGAVGQDVFIQNFQTNMGHIVNDGAIKTHEYSISDLVEEQGLKPIKSFFMGRYHYYSRVVSDREDGITYLYTGGLDENGKPQGLLYSWSTEDAKWQFVDLTIDKYVFPFLNLTEISEGVFYFLIKDKEGVNAVYKRGI